LKEDDGKRMGRRKGLKGWKGKKVKGSVLDNNSKFTKNP